MTEEDVPLSHLTLDDIVSARPEAPISESSSVDCGELASIYGNAVKDLQAREDEPIKRVYEFLQQLCWMIFKPSDKAEPFGPILVIEGRRSLIPSDLRGKQNDVLAVLASLIKNPALRARLADIAWLNHRRLAECGRLAVNSYVECIEILLKGQGKLRFEYDKPWDVTALEMLRRALVIADAMGRDKDEACLVRATIEKVRAAAKECQNDAGYLRAAKLAMDAAATDAAEIGNDLETLAEKVRVSGDFPFAIEIYKEAERARRILRDDEGSDRCGSAAAECYVGWADTCKDSAIHESHWLQQAITKLRNIRGSRERRRELQARLVAVQPFIRDEMEVFETEIDLTDLVNHTRNTICGHSFIRALGAFAQLCRSPNPEDLRDRARRDAERSVLASLFSATIHDDEGKVVARTPGADHSSGTDEADLHHLILQNEAHRRGIGVSGLIEPARQILHYEHPIEERDLLPLMEMSPFVPPGRELIFARAFSRFFGGDFMSAIHLLFPQLENSLRFVLKLAGSDPTSTKTDDTQQDITISVMLEQYRVQLERVFGPAIVMEIENLFDTPAGPSVRHSAAHGLLKQGAFSGPDIIYACWFIFRLIVVPLFRHWEEVEKFYERQGER